LRVFAVVHGERRATAWIAGCSFALVGVSLLLVPLGLAGGVYAATALVSGVALSAYAIAGVIDGHASTAWRGGSSSARSRTSRSSSSSSSPGHGELSA
jgi:heme O synthase-like polyprenyltransferase